MATLSDGAFRFLSLCAHWPGSAAFAQRLSTALSAVSSFGELVTPGEQHPHPGAGRARVVADVAREMGQARVPFLVLKGAALAHLVYGDPRLRPMRDVDLLIRKTDAGRALDVLVRCGFRPGGTVVPARHHHVQGMAKTLDGATVTIELPHELLARTPFVEPRDYDDLIRRS